MNNKFLFLLHLPPPYHGVAVINSKIKDGAVNKYFDPDIISINTSKELRSIGSFSLRKVFGFFGILLRIIHSLLRNRYMFCYFSLTPKGIGFYKDFLIVLMLKAFKVKILFHLHGQGFASVKNPLGKFCRKICFSGQKAIVLSDALYSDIAGYLPKEDVYSLPNGIESVFKGEANKDALKKSAGNSRAKFLFLGNMVNGKGVFVALEACRVLKESGCEFTLDFAGDWFDITEREFTLKVNQLQVADCVHYLGYKSGDDKKNLLLNADIFIYPTYNDAFPLVLLEAMDAGLAILSTYEGAIPSLVEDGVTGFLVSKNDPQALARRAKELIKDSVLR